MDEVETHIMGQIVDYDDLSTIVCWGAMEVGSPCWEAYHGSGIHPMTQVLNMVKDKMKEHGIDG